MTRTQAIGCDAPQPLSAQTAELVPVEAAGLDVAVRHELPRGAPPCLKMTVNGPARWMG